MIGEIKRGLISLGLNFYITIYLSMDKLQYLLDLSSSISLSKYENSVFMFFLSLNLISDL